MIASSQTSLESLRDAAWNLEDFVAEVNSRLLTMQPTGYGDARQRDDFSVRLLRHYASLGLVDESERVGREARYRYRHLLQIICLRQLQRQGWNSKAIADFTARENPELEAFLNGQTLSETNLIVPDSRQVTAGMSHEEAFMPPSAPAPSAAPEQKTQSVVRKKALKESALEFLDTLRSRESAPKQQIPAPLPQFLLHDPPRSPERWRRVEIAPGLEIHISDRYRQARNTADKRRLLEAIEQTLENQ